MKRAIIVPCRGAEYNAPTIPLESMLDTLAAWTVDYTKSAGANLAQAGNCVGESASGIGCARISNRVSG